MTVKVVFHIDENSKWGLLLKNVHNLAQSVELSGNKIEVLANSEAVKFYIETTENSEKVLMKELAFSGIRFTACNNALNSMGIQPKQLMQFVEVVPVGVLELIERQAEGYAYIKP
jgi:intracellular sulfur oxidation DsrE/DsrF family protein